MLQYVTHRLVTVNEVQQRELAACDYNTMRENWKEIADSQRADVKMPDPTNGLNAPHYMHVLPKSSAMGDI